MSAETIARALGGSKSGAGWMARCPAHSDRVPSLSLSDGPDGRVLVHCHAGCDQQSVIGALKSLGLCARPSKSFVPGDRAGLNSDQPTDHPSGQIWPAMVALVTHKLRIARTMQL
jgi:hypothetical protein